MNVFKREFFYVDSSLGNEYSLTFTPGTATEKVAWNGLVLKFGEFRDYTFTGNVLTLNTSLPLTIGDKVLIEYSYSD